MKFKRKSISIYLVAAPISSWRSQCHSLADADPENLGNGHWTDLDIFIIYIDSKSKMQENKTNHNFRYCFGRKVPAERVKKYFYDFGIFLLTMNKHSYWYTWTLINLQNM